MSLENNRKHQPFGEDGPRVRKLSRSEIPKPDSQLSLTGFKIIKIIGTRVIGIRALAEEVGMLADYSGYIGMMETLQEKGYVSIDVSNRVTLTNKGKSELV